MTGFSRILPWVGVMVLFFGAASTSGVALWRIDAQAQEIEDVVEDVDRNEDDIEQIQRLLIRRQGEVENQVQRIEIEQRQQGETLDEIKSLLLEATRGN